MHVSLPGTRRPRRATPPLAARFNGFEVLMFGLLALGLVDCAIVAYLIVRGVNW